MTDFVRESAGAPLSRASESLLSNSSRVLLPRVKRGGGERRRRTKRVIINCCKDQPLYSLLLIFPSFPPRNNSTRRPSLRRNTPDEHLVVHLARKDERKESREKRTPSSFPTLPLPLPPSFSDPQVIFLRF